MNNYQYLKNTNDQLQDSIVRLLAENERLRRIVYQHTGTVPPIVTGEPVKNENLRDWALGTTKCICDSCKKPFKGSKVSIYCKLCVEDSRLKPT